MAKNRGKSSQNTASPRTSYSVFLSHATHDKWIARTICEKIESAGGTTFRDDRDIQGGDRIPESIRNSIQTSDEVIVLLTPESIARQWILLEIGMAYATERRIVPIFYHIAPDQIPDIIRDNRGFSLNEFDQYLDQLTERMSQ